MRTNAILVLTLLMSVLLISASSADNQPQLNVTITPTPLLNNMTTSHEAADDKPGSATNWTQFNVITQVKNNVRQNDTVSTSPTSPSSSSIVTSQFSSSVPTTSTIPSTSKSVNSKLMLFLILLAIIVFMLFVGCIHAMKDQDSSIHRLLLVIRKRLRTAVGNLEDWIGLHLWPGGKREGNDDEEEADKEIHGGRNEEKGEHKVEDSDSSDDHSSIMGDNQRERVLSRQEEGNHNKEETSSASEGDQSVVEGKSSEASKGGSEEIALVSPLQNDDEKVDLCDITVL